jgi:hypothetical protein
MTEEQRKLCRDLTIQPDGRSRITKEDFLRRFPSSVEEGKVASRVLEDAYATQSAEDLQCALIIGFAFGFATAHKEILSRLIDVDWHNSHEDVVEALDELRTPDAVDALFRATQWIPKSLEYDDSRALAVKAIWALAKLTVPEAETKLEIIARSNSAVLRKAAIEQLQRRRRAT